MKKGVVFTALSIVALTGVIWTAASKSEAGTVLDAYASQLQANRQTTGALEYVNNHPVMNADFNQFMIGQQLIEKLNGQPVESRDQLLTAFNREQVEYQAAEKEGMSVSMATAEQYANNERQLIENPSPNDKNAPQMLKIIQSEESGLGISDAEYWGKFAPRWYQFGMTIGAFRASYENTYKQQHPQSSPAAMTTAFNSYVDQLVGSATISSKN